MQTFREPELHYRRLFDTVQDGILILDAETGVIEDVNAYLPEMLGFPREEFVGKVLWDVDPFTGSAASQRAFQGLQKNEYTHYEDLQILAKSGRLYQMEFVSNVYPVNNEKIIQCYIRDISARSPVQDLLLQSETPLRSQSIWDELTGLFNRSYMDGTLERELLRAARKGLPVGIIMLDVDDFDRFKNRYGETGADAMLRGLGNFLLKHVRGEDIVCRYGGDEFVIVMPEASLKVTWERAELICKYAKQFHFQFEGQPLEAVALSLGVAVSPDDGMTSAEMLRTVEAALYHAKDEGRGQVVVAS